MASSSKVTEFLVQEGQLRFEEAKKLCDEESKNDPENEPFKSKYKAREIWKDLQSDIKNILENADSLDETENLDLLCMTSVLDLKIGVNYIETDELSSGEEHLKRALEALESFKLSKKACHIVQSVLNQLGILWAVRNEHTHAYEYLNKAEILYKDFKHDTGNSPLTVDEHFYTNDAADEGGIDHKRMEDFENTYTLTLYYLAQVYTKLGETEKSARYCHVTLSRQLKTRKYDAFDWALNAATLSQYYITQRRFRLARHCLASATHIFQEVPEPDPSLQPHDEESQSDIDAREKVPRARADINRCWAKYGIALLEESWNRLLRQVDEMDLEDDDEKKSEETNDEDNDREAGANSREETPKSKLLFDLELTSIEELITDQYVRDFDEARIVFLQTQKWIVSAKEFYLLDGHATDNVELAQDHSALYRSLAFFEPSFERQCKMHKRRVDMLADLLGELSMQFYLLVCRQLMFEIGETYSTMLDLKLAIIEQHGSPPNSHAVAKINQLADNAIKFYKKYIDSLRKPDKTLPDKFESDDLRPALIAHFYIGRLYSKFIESETSKKIDNVSMSLENYKFLVDYCHRHPETSDRVEQELAVCQEMVLLLPHKMEKIRQRDSSF